MKFCKHCGEHKPETDFHKKAQAKDGLAWWCKTCHQKSMRDRYHALAADPAYKQASVAKTKAYWQAHPDKYALAAKKYVENNRAKVNAKLRKRYANKLNRTPLWLTEDDLWIIEQAYELAALRTTVFGFAWHVDHVVPLQGKLVSGLHVPHNLQVIPARDNRAKSNKFATT
jgi:hypothetical protein